MTQRPPEALAALASELIQYIGAAETRYTEGIDAGNPPVNKNARQAALVEEVAAKIREAIYGNAPLAPAVPLNVAHDPANPPPRK